MVTVPTDIPSFAMGFDLRAANYSTPGSGGGTFANLVSGQEAWTTGSDVPSFSAFSGLEGMNFANSVNSLIQGRMRAMSEFTILAIARVGSASTNVVFGGLNTAANTAAMQVAVGVNFTVGGSAFLESAVDNSSTAQNTTFVGTGSWSPANQTLYGQVNQRTVVTDASWTGANPTTLGHWQAAIGAHRTTYITGWIARVLIFSRALHYRDNTLLQDLIDTEMASVGL